MKILRALIILLACAIFGIGALVIRYVVFNFQKKFIKDKSKLIFQQSKTLQNSWKIFIGFLIKTKIFDIQSNSIEKIKNIKNSIIVSTHPTFVDVIILISIIPYTTCFVAKKLAKNPFFKGMVDAFFVLRDDDSEVWLKNAEKYLDLGFNILIFPMGKRHGKNEFPKIRKSAAYLAQKTSKNIAMLKLSVDSEIFARNRAIYDVGSSPSHYKLEYLDIIDMEKQKEIYKDEVTLRSEVTKYISKNLYKEN